MREVKESRIDKLKTELVRAREKASEWQARVRDIERQITELDNVEIIQTVRGIMSAPEDLRELLNMIRAVNQPPQNNTTKKEERIFEKMD